MFQVVVLQHLVADCFIFISVRYPILCEYAKQHFKKIQPADNGTPAHRASEHSVDSRTVCCENFCFVLFSFGNIIFCFPRRARKYGNTVVNHQNQMGIVCPQIIAARRCAHRKCENWILRVSLCDSNVNVCECIANISNWWIIRSSILFKLLDSLTVNFIGLNRLVFLVCDKPIHPFGQRRRSMVAPQFFPYIFCLLLFCLSIRTQFVTWVNFNWIILIWKKCFFMLGDSRFIYT